MRLLNSFVTRKAMSQLVRTQMPVATPLTCKGKISDMRSQGMGPQPTAKPVGARWVSAGPWAAALPRRRAWAEGDCNPACAQQRGAHQLYAFPLHRQARAPAPYTQVFSL